MQIADAPWQYLDEALARGHVPVRHALQRLVDQACSIAPEESIPSDDAEGSTSLLGRVHTLCELILRHLQREEAYVFPLLRVPILRPNSAAIRLMQRDHGEQLDCLRETRAYVIDRVSASADGTRLAALDLSLAHLERTLVELILLEEHHLYAPVLGRS